MMWQTVEEKQMFLTNFLTQQERKVYYFLECFANFEFEDDEVTIDYPLEGYLYIYFAEELHDELMKLIAQIDVSYFNKMRLVEVTGEHVDNNGMYTDDFRTQIRAFLTDKATAIKGKIEHILVNQKEKTSCK